MPQKMERHMTKTGILCPEHHLRHKTPNMCMYIYSHIYIHTHTHIQTMHDNMHTYNKHKCTCIWYSLNSQLSSQKYDPNQAPNVCLNKSTWYIISTYDLQFGCFYWKPHPFHMHTLTLTYTHMHVTHVQQHNTVEFKNCVIFRCTTKR